MNNLTKNAKIIIGVTIIVILLVAVVLSVYFLINIDLNKKLEMFFNDEELLQYYDNNVGVKINVDQKTIEAFLTDELKDAKFRNTIKFNNKKGGGILLLKGDNAILFLDDFILIGNNWYKTDVSIYSKLQSIINNLL